MYRDALNTPFKSLRDYIASYGLWGAFSISLNLVTTKIRFRNARIIRPPFYIRGRRWIQVGSGFTTGRGLRMEAYPADRNRRIRIDIGHHVQINDDVHIAAVDLVQIGNHVLIASKVYISDHNHGTYSGAGQDSPLVPPEARKLSFKPVTIDDNVWIGEFVSILPGVHIGEGSIIGTMSVVNRDIPPYSIAVGSPAKVIKQFNFQTDRWERL